MITSIREDAFEQYLSQSPRMRWRMGLGLTAAMMLCLGGMTASTSIFYALPSRPSGPTMTLLFPVAWMTPLLLAMVGLALPWYLAVTFKEAFFRRHRMEADYTQVQNAWAAAMVVLMLQLSVVLFFVT